MNRQEFDITLFDFDRKYTLELAKKSLFGNLSGNLVDLLGSLPKNKFNNTLISNIIRVGINRVPKNIM